MTRTRRLPLVGFLAAALIAAGCTLPAFAPRVADDGDSAARPGAASWRPCPEVPEELIGHGARSMTYECATITVPSDWEAAGSANATAGGESFEIALLRIRSAKQRNRIGSLVINPGGPGGSGIDAAVYLSFGSAFGGLPEEVTSRFDIVGFDPRGVARSSPITCLSDADLDASFGFDPDPQDQAKFDALVAMNRKIGERCGDKYGDQLRLYSTEQSARDMDAIRIAVGDDKLTYLGYSYGTLLGATYAHLFPRNVRALVLDGAVDPQRDSIAGSESQAKGFEQAFTNFTRWCETTPDKCPITPDARAVVTAAIEKARVSPVRGSDGRDATAGWVFFAVVSSLYSEAGWERLAAAFDKLEGGDPSGIFDLADSYAERDKNGHYSNLFDANLAVNCADEKKAPSVAQARRLQSEWRAKYPLFGAPLAAMLTSCAVWPGQRDPYPTGSADGAPPILVIGTTGDPATPYEQAPKLADLLGVGQVLTWEGEGHTAYPQTRCINNAVNDYLISLRLPPKDLRCPAR
ncbi:MAG TPA: alpha/beta hydrolase [Micromonospora sp.]|nr:alpha/beta hydrolase [Micromonospora sp.]